MDRNLEPVVTGQLTTPEMILIKIRLPKPVLLQPQMGDML
jgi:hypothetical protein